MILTGPFGQSLAGAGWASTAPVVAMSAAPAASCRKRKREWIRMG
jgi:hypothetical protein